MGLNLMKFFKNELEQLSISGKVVWGSAFLLLVSQIFGIIYLNLVKMPYFTGFDASAYYVLAHEMVKQGKIMVDHFVYNTTTLLWDSPLLLAAAFHLFIDDIFLCYGLSNIVSCFFMIFTVTILGKQLEIKWKGQLIVLICLLTPYVSNYFASNDLGYFSMLFISMGAYAWRLPILLWVQIMFISWDTEGFTRKNAWKYFIGLPLLALSCVSSGSFLLVFAVAPLVLFVLIRAIIEDKWLNIHHNSIGFVGVMLLIALASMAFTKYVLHFESLDTGSFWVSVHLFFENLQSIFLGMMILLGGFPLYSDISVFSTTGILYGLRLALVMIFFAGTFYGIWLKRKSTAHQVVACLIFSHFLIFTCLYTKYGATIFEVRYLIFIFVACMFFFGVFMDKIQSSNNSSFKTVLATLLGICFISNNVSSHQILEEEKTDYDFLVELSDYLSQFDDPVVYFTGDSQYFQVVSANMRAVDFSKVYKFSPDLKTRLHTGDYDYFDDNGEYEGSTLLITVPWMFSDLDPVFQNAYDLIYSFPEEEVYIYQSKENLVDLASGTGKRSFSRDFPYSSGVDCNENMGEFNDSGHFLSNGSGGYLCSSEFEIEVSGVYDFSLQYETTKSQENIGSFAVSVNGELLSSAVIEKNKKEAQILSLDLSEMEGETLVFSVFVEENAELAIHSFEYSRYE